MIKIEDHIPAPKRRFALEGHRAEIRRTLARMKVGQSFVWPDNRVLYYIAAENGVKIKTRKLNEGGYRVWKVK